ncbi:MAG: SDR family NAD(P)-dependent oxidoreductase, partial [Halioglobus sp.]|nr:SDR family NAD(P)-dependent oxidoreductase [Halioglobus sp.]
MIIDHKKYSAADDLLRGKAVLVTGASDGIGRALAVEAARRGARVILHGRNAAKLEKVYDTIDAIDGCEQPSIAVMDLASADANSYTSLADSLLQEFGQLDGLV